MKISGYWEFKVVEECDNIGVKPRSFFRVMELFCTLAVVVET